MGNIEHGGTPEQTNAEATEDAIRALADGTLDAQWAAKVKLRKIAAEADNHRGAVEALRLIAEDRVPCDDLSADTAIPAAVRAFARDAIGGQ